MNFVKKLVLPIALACTLSFGTNAAFEKVNTYEAGTFNDVPETAWYAGEVKSSYELGLFGGKGEGVFDPSGKVTVAEAITLACRASSAYSGVAIPEKNGGKWYDMYVDYAKTQGFLKDGEFDNFDRPAKRFEVASLFAKAMPDGYYTAKNNVDVIPDVFGDAAYANDILMLYKAGIVMGSDAYGNFRPEDNITRAECAAIINRVALPENRVEGTLDKYSQDDAYLLNYNISMNGYKEGINSGWILDNRGAVPKTSLESGYDSLTDISTTDGAAMIREFNKITTGKIDAEISMAVTPKKFDGVSLEYRNDKDESVYKIVTEDGAWKYVNADGTKTLLLEKASDIQNFDFRITVDLDNNKASTVINGKECGEFALMTKGEDTNILNFRFATDKEKTPAITMGRVKMTVNYGVNDDFDLDADGSIPYGWTGKGVVKNDVLYLEKGESNKTFAPQSGTVIANAEYNLTKSQSTSFKLRSGAKDIVSVTTDGKSFYANGEKIYDYVPNIWYRVRIEADTKTNKAIIHINGRNIATVDFAEKTTSVDNITLANGSSDAVEFDDVNVFRKQKHDDYVPVPVMPKGTDKYIVGINICSLWVNGTHYGWSCISAHEDHIPVLGLYDEGLPESADWEIKYFVEHGIDFQAFCWYPDNGNAPIKTPDYGAQLYDGFMFAEYSDMTNYCILWEARNSKRPTSVDSFKKYFAPYLIEHFFKDPRYMVIDNMPILSIYGQTYLAESLGGNDKLKECLDYLEGEVKKLGFDGVIFDCCGSASAEFEAMGFDSCHAYGWGNGGYSLDINKTNINKSAAYKGVYTIPTISVGFNSIPWHDIKYPLMTVEDFKTAQEWVKNEYLPANAKKGTWQEKTVWLSTWNEYGEGTYIMPSEKHVGFGYIDVIREAYTSEKIDESLNAVPNAAQKERINHLFPQYRKLLRKQGEFTNDVNTDELVTLYTIDYTKKDRITVSHTNKFEFTDEGLVGTVIGDTHIITNSLDLDTEDISHVRVTLDVPAGTWVQMYFITNQSPNWNADKQIGFGPEKGTMASYLVEMTTVKNWSGRVTGFRIDPGQSAAGVEGNQFKIKSIEFMTKPDRASKKMTVNGETFDMQFPYQQGKNGDLLFAFDPEFALDFRLGCFHIWDADNKQLTLQMNGKTLVYTIGKDTYTLNGSEKKLPEAMTTLDGLPLIPLKQFCEDAGFKYSVNEKGIAVIETHEKEYFDMIAARTKGHWNFDVDGDTEKWTSTFMNLSAWDGALVATSNSDHKDPTINLGTKAGIKAANYVAVEVRCRYKYEADKNHPWVLYFTTDRDNKMDEKKSVRAYLKSTDSKGEWEIYRVDLTNVESWRNTIADLRFDPFNAVGTMEIDYIRFIEGENEAAMQTAPNGIKIFNADAEGKSFQFFSDNAKLSIVDDPVREGNKCYLVGANGDKKNWYYIRQLIEYTPGATYKVCYDLKIASHGTNTELDENFGTNITYNARYGGSEEASVDHVGMAQTKHVKVGDGWVRAEITFTVSEKSDIRHEDQFAVYANPVNDIGVAFYIDNITIEEVKE